MTLNQFCPRMQSKWGFFPWWFCFIFASFPQTIQDLILGICDAGPFFLILYTYAWAITFLKLSIFFRNKPFITINGSIFTYMLHSQQIFEGNAKGLHTLGIIKQSKKNAREIFSKISRMDPFTALILLHGPIMTFITSFGLTSVAFDSFMSGNYFVLKAWWLWISVNTIFSTMPYFWNKPTDILNVILHLPVFIPCQYLIEILKFAGIILSFGEE